MLKIQNVLLSVCMLYAAWIVVAEGNGYAKRFKRPSGTNPVLQQNFEHADAPDERFDERDRKTDRPVSQQGQLAASEAHPSLANATASGSEDIVAIPETSSAEDDESDEQVGINTSSTGVSFRQSTTAGFMRAPPQAGFTFVWPFSKSSGQPGVNGDHLNSITRSTDAPIQTAPTVPNTIIPPTTDFTFIWPFSQSSGHLGATVAGAGNTRLSLGPTTRLSSVLPDTSSVEDDGSDEQLAVTISLTNGNSGQSKTAGHTGMPPEAGFTFMWPFSESSGHLGVTRADAGNNNLSLGPTTGIPIALAETTIAPPEAIEQTINQSRSENNLRQQGLVLQPWGDLIIPATTPSPFNSFPWSLNRNPPVLMKSSGGAAGESAAAFDQNGNMISFDPPHKENYYINFNDIHRNNEADSDGVSGQNNQSEFRPRAFAVKSGSSRSDGLTRRSLLCLQLALAAGVSALRRSLSP